MASYREVLLSNCSSLARILLWYWNSSTARISACEGGEL